MSCPEDWVVSVFGFTARDPDGNDFTESMVFEYAWKRRHDSPMARRYVQLLILHLRLKRDRQRGGTIGASRG